MINYFRILGVSTSATAEELRVARKKKSRETHPDHGGNRTAFGEVIAAYDTLSDPLKRRDYERAYIAYAGTLGHAVCSRCFAINRVRALQSGEVARCASCKAVLEVSDEHRRAQYGDALKAQLGDLFLTIGAETGSLAQDAIKAGARAIRRKLGLDKGGM